jgi:CelD/BcsL family acetyltransferase involved in cellulose biosynthesis
MVEAAIFGTPLAEADADTAPVGAAALGLGLSVSSTHLLAEVEAVWRAFSAAGIESPGQSFSFIKLWVEALGVAEADQLYVVAALGGQPVALLPLRRQRRASISLYSWFPGTHVGCNAPLVDAARLGQLSPAELQRFWQGVVEAIDGADLIYLPAIPARDEGPDPLFAGLGQSLPVETLYRSVFASWDDANTTQRSKSRRKHDRQQGEKLEALGAVSFEVVEPGPAAAEVLEVMFRQRARRFVAMGIKDPFAPCDIARFYNATGRPGSPVAIKLHVLRLNGEIVAVRYNVVHGDRLFCLISSMSDDPAIQAGPPGKQCLLRVMETVFDEGFRVFDMGAGFTDEKRHWCNQQIALCNHYVPLTLRGRAIVATHAAWRSTRARIKANETLLRVAKAVRARLARKTASSETRGE